MLCSLGSFSCPGQAPPVPPTCRVTEDVRLRAMSCSASFKSEKGITIIIILGNNTTEPNISVSCIGLHS